MPFATETSCEVGSARFGGKYAHIHHDLLSLLLLVGVVLYVDTSCLGLLWDCRHDGKSNRTATEGKS
jgi:hypothetical protein